MTKLSFDPSATSIIVKAKIEAPRGIQFANLVFDTGASLVMLPWDIAIGVGLVINPKRTIKTTTASSVETSPLTTIPAVSVLGMTVKNVGCIVRDLPPSSNVDGLLGLSFLRNFNVTINFEKGILSLDRIKKV